MYAIPKTKTKHKTNSNQNEPPHYSKLLLLKHSIVSPGQNKMGLRVGQMSLWAQYLLNTSAGLHFPSIIW